METAAAFLRYLNQPLLVLDGRLRLEFANPAFYALFDIDSPEAEAEVTKNLVFGDFLHPGIQESLESAIRGDGMIKPIECVCRQRTGRELTLQVVIRRVVEAGIPEMILVEPRDITRERAAEQKAISLNDALQKHVAALDAMNRELESYGHSVSHDLRTPLRFVNRIAHMLLHGPGPPLSEGAAEQVNQILSATSEMGVLIERLLHFSQVSREPMKLRRVDLSRLFREAAKELEPIQAGRLLEIDIQAFPPCQGDRTLLKEVATNLLANALKFTRPRNPARIVVGCTVVENTPAYFVQDNGVGFDMKDYDALFLPFHRLHRSSEFEGSGIGLTLVKRIVERHGGRAWAEGEVDRGATFFFTLGRPEQTTETRGK